MCRNAFMKYARKWSKTPVGLQYALDAFCAVRQSSHMLICMWPILLACHSQNEYQCIKNLLNS